MTWSTRFLLHRRTAGRVWSTCRLSSASFLSYSHRRTGSRHEQVREATEEEAKAPLAEWQELMIRKRKERKEREEAVKKSGESGSGRGSPGPRGDGKGSSRSHGSGRRSKHEGRVSSRRKKYRRNEFLQMQQQEVRVRMKYSLWVFRRVLFLVLLHVVGEVPRDGWPFPSAGHEPFIPAYHVFSSELPGFRLVSQSQIRS